MQLSKQLFTDVLENRFFKKFLKFHAMEFFFNVKLHAVGNFSAKLLQALGNLWYNKYLN